MKTQTPVIALTGGIASGKTAVSDHLATLGVPIIDTDLISREVVRPGQLLLQELVKQFGKDILAADGSLNRAALRERIFNDENQRKALEALLHPAILREVQRRIASVNAPYCVVVIPLLAENKRHPWIGRVLLVDTPERLQLERVRLRDELSEEKAQAILDAQASREDRLKIADDVIVNDGTLAQLRAATDAQHAKYIRIFADHR